MPKLIRIYFLCVTFHLMNVVFSCSAVAQCTEKNVWDAFPTTDALIKQGVPINEQLRSDSGPDLGKDNTKTYARYWQGGSKSRGLSLRFIIYPNKQLAADAVQKYGQGIIKTNNGIQVQIGDLGYKTVDLMRPYYMIQKKCLVITYYTSHPKRRPVGDQDAIVKFIISRFSSLACCTTGSNPPPLPNRCPVIQKCTFSPSNPTPLDVITFTGSATDKDMDKLFYTWEIYNFNKKRVKTLTGATARWHRPLPGNYRVNLVVKDNGPYCFDVQTKTVVVVANPTLPNLSPVIRLSVSPTPARTNSYVTITASVQDPEGDSVRGGWGYEGRGGGRASYPRLQKKQGSGQPKNIIKNRTANVFTWKGYVIAGSHNMKFVVEDNRGAKASKLIFFVAIDPQAPLKITLVRTPKSYSISTPPVHIKVVDNAQAGETLTYAWTVDNKRQKNWTGKKITWMNPSAGRHEINVRVWKKNGETDAAKTIFEITQAPPPPPQNNPPKATIILLTKNPIAGAPVKFKVSISDPDKKDVHNILWKVNGQITGSTKIISWTPKKAAKFTMNVLVSDGKDSVRDSLSFYVAKPLIIPPPPKRSIIQQAGHYHTNIILGDTKARIFQTGEQIALRLEILPQNPRHRLLIRWSDPSGNPVQEKSFNILRKNLKKIQYKEDLLTTVSMGPTGTWTVDIMVDRKFDRRITFSLQAPRSKQRLPKKKPKTGTLPSPGSPGQWNSVF